MDCPIPETISCFAEKAPIYRRDDPRQRELEEAIEHFAGCEPCRILLIREQRRKAVRDYIGILLLGTAIAFGYFWPG